MTIEARATHAELIQRSLAIMKDYCGDNTVTLKLNCFGGILLIVRELLHKPSVDDPILSQTIHDDPWLIPRCHTSGKMLNATLWSLILHVRDALGHPRVSPWNEGGELRGFEFRASGDAWLRLSEQDILNISNGIVEKLLPKLSKISQDRWDLAGRP